MTNEQTTARQLAGDPFVFQQDSVPSHHARATVKYLHQATAEFVSPNIWPPNSLTWTQ